MNLSIKIANRPVTISFLGETGRVFPLLKQFFRDFLCPEEKDNCRIMVRILRTALPHGLDVQNCVIEQKVPIRDVASWLKSIPDHDRDFPLDNETIASFCLGGLLLFNPDARSGIIYLLREGVDCFMPLFRLFWIYFAQVLGESNKCFIHSAALVKDKKGYLFLGDSGAGKSTLASVSREAITLSDDSPIFSKLKGEYVVFPSPYHQIDPVKGLGREAAGMNARVEGIYFLFKDQEVFRERLSRIEAVSMIIKRYILFFPYLSRRAKTDLFDLILGACNKIPVYNLHFCLDQDVWGEVIDS